MYLRIIVTLKMGRIDSDLFSIAEIFRPTSTQILAILAPFRPFLERLSIPRASERANKTSE
jgi:hypothetical protein